MKNILVAIDFTDITNRVLEKTLQIAARFKSRIWIIHVVNPAGYYAPYGGYSGVAGTTIPVPEAGFVGMESGVPIMPDEQSRELLLNAEQEKLQRLADQIKSQGFDTQIIVSEGDATDAILEETKNLKIDLIVMGFHEHGFLYNTFIGSTAEDMLKKSEVAMLIVPEEKVE